MKLLPRPNQPRGPVILSINNTRTTCALPSISGPSGRWLKILSTCVRLARGLRRAIAWTCYNRPLRTSGFIADQGTSHFQILSRGPCILVVLPTRTMPRSIRPGRRDGMRRPSLRPYFNRDSPGRCYYPYCCHSPYSSASYLRIPDTPPRGFLWEPTPRLPALPRSRPLAERERENQRIFFPFLLLISLLPAPLEAIGSPGEHHTVVFSHISSACSNASCRPSHPHPHTSSATRAAACHGLEGRGGYDHNDADGRGADVAQVSSSGSGPGPGQ